MRGKVIDWTAMNGRITGSLCAFAVLLVPSSCQGASPVTLAIAPTARHQSIDCFGASGAWSMDHVGAEWSLENRERVADLLFSTETGIGLSGWKFIVGAGSAGTDTDVIRAPNEWRMSECFRSGRGDAYDWERQAGQRWFLDAARARGVASLHAVFYSPPVWMTKNGHGQPDEGSGTTNLPEDRFGEFAAYMADVVQRFGFTDVFPVNEPNWDWNQASQEGNRYLLEEVARLAGLLRGELDARGIGARIVAPEAGELRLLTNGGYMMQLIKNAGARAVLSDTVSGHSYWSDYNDGAGDDRLVALRRQVRTSLDSFAEGIGFRQTEYCILGRDGPGRDLGMKPALRMARVMQMDLTLLDAREWSWWLALSPYDYKDGLLYTDYGKPGDPETVIPSKLFWAFGNFSRFIRPGFTRIEVAGASDPNGLLASAFRDAATNACVVVVVNMAAADREVRLEWDDAGTAARPRGFVPWLTSAAAGDDLRRLASVPLGQACAVPGSSVVTFVGY
jgi:hypothetical protein